MVHQSHTILCETPKLRIEISLDQNRLYVRPVGTIDEDADLVSILNLCKTAATNQVLCFDMGHVSRINSCGVREWVLMMDRLSMSSTFVNVNEIFLDQINIVPDLLGKKRMPVLSFYIPYHCENCKQTTHLLVDARQVQLNEKGSTPPTFKCEKCSKPMEMDWVDEEYFNFLKRQNKKP